MPVFSVQPYHLCWKSEDKKLQAFPNKDGFYIRATVRNDNGEWEAKGNGKPILTDDGDLIQVSNGKQVQDREELEAMVKNYFSPPSK